MQLSGDVVKNYKIWYVWEGEKYEISEKDEYNYLIQGTVFSQWSDLSAEPYFWRPHKTRKRMRREDPASFEGTINESFEE